MASSSRPYLGQGAAQAELEGITRRRAKGRFWVYKRVYGGAVRAGWPASVYPRGTVGPGGCVLESGVGGSPGGGPARRSMVIERKKE